MRERRSAISREFKSFMRVVLKPVEQLRAEEDPIARMRNAQSIDDLADSDLLWLLRGAMLKEGVKPLGAADNIHAHLVDRAARREVSARGGCNG